MLYNEISKIQLYDTQNIFLHFLTSKQKLNVNMIQSTEVVTKHLRSTVN